MLPSPWKVMLLMATDGVLMARPERLVLPLGVASLSSTTYRKRKFVNTLFHA